MITLRNVMARISDAEFISVWNLLNSCTEVAKHFNMLERNCYAKRRKIEQKYNILLGIKNTHNSNGDSIPEEIAKMVTSSRVEVNTLSLKNGVIVIGSDCHYHPKHIPVAHKAMCNVIADLGPKVSAIILNGDLLDGGTISRYPMQRSADMQKPSLFQEIEAVQERLTDFENLKKYSGAKLMRTIGNHDLRVSAKLMGAVGGLYEGVVRTLKDYLPLWAESFRIDVNDDTVIIHDWHGGIHADWNNVLKSGGFNVITGHTHQMSCKAHRGFGNKTHYGVSLGFMADEYQSEFDYRLGKPGLNWQSGFAVLTWVDGIMLHPEFCAVRDDNQAYFRGKRYA